MKTSNLFDKTLLNLLGVFLVYYMLRVLSSTKAYEVALAIPSFLVDRLLDSTIRDIFLVQSNLLNLETFSLQIKYLSL